jgi:hypothetical protein
MRPPDPKDRVPHPAPRPLVRTPSAWEQIAPAKTLIALGLILIAVAYLTVAATQKQKQDEQFLKECTTQPWWPGCPNQP